MPGTRRTREREDQPRPRFGVYLTPEQLEWINRTRGRYLMETGKDVRATTILRLAIDELRSRGFDEVKRLLSSSRHP